MIPGLDCIRAIQIGDIHYPELSATTALVDANDPAAPASWSDALTPNRLKCVSDAVLACLRDNPHSFLFFTGDLTSRANLPAYRDCVAYLHQAFSLDDRSLWPLDRIHAVPGNHDIDRAVAAASPADSLNKFKEICAAWDDIGTPILQPSLVRSTTLYTSGSSATAFSVNSCIGCGDKRKLPPTIQNDLFNLLRPYFAKSDVPSFDLIAEQLDTPAILDAHLTSLEHEIQTLSTTALPIIVGHHGLLPQALTRISLYTELLNGGYIRLRLSSLGRPIVYCHGHVHVDTMEVLSQPKERTGALISIAAPAYTDGFNELLFYFARSGEPIGCEVICHRINEYGGVRQQAPLRIPLQHPRAAATLCGRAGYLALKKVPPTGIRFDALRNAWPKHDPRPHTRTLESALLELEWLGLVTILNRTEESRFWQISKVGPTP